MNKTSKSQNIKNLIIFDAQLDDLKTGEITVDQFVGRVFPYAIDEAIIMLEYGELELPFEPKPLLDKIKAKYKV